MEDWSGNPDDGFDPDIHGVGMVVGFLVTAYLALFLLLVQYVLDFDPTLNPFRRPGQPMRLLRPNPIDMLIHRCKLWFCVRVLRIKKFSTRNDRLQPTGGMTHESDDGDSISKAILNVGDIQTIAGLALLISGYYELAYNYLTLEKWRFIGRLAWFSTVTHLAVASCLMGFLYRHFYICLLRVFFMVCLVILLLGATVPFYKVGGVESDVPAIYLYLIHSNPSTLEVEPIFAGILICLSLFVRLYKLFESPSQLLSYFLDKYISRIPGWLIHGIACLQTRSTRWNVLLHMLVLQPFVACLILTKTYLFLLSSKAFEIFIIVVVAVYGTSHLFSIWNINRDYRLTFGQVVPLVMLFAPFFILWDHFVGRWPSTKSNIIARGTDNGVEASPTQTLDVNGLLTQPAPVRSPTTARALYYAPLDSLISTEPSAVTGSIRLHRLAEAESGSFCTISVLPLLQMPQGSRDNRHPSLGRFEILPWFSYLMPQLFAAGTLLIFLRINPVDIIGDSAVSVFIASEMLLVLGMESQLLFILMWPRDPYSFGLAQCMSPKYRKLLYGCLSSLFVLVFFGVSIFLLAPFLFPLYSDPWFLKAAWYCLTVLYIIFCIVWALVLPHGKSTRVLARGSDQTIALEGIPADQRPVEV